jgi:hypothetical protein
LAIDKVLSDSTCHPVARTITTSSKYDWNTSKNRTTSASQLPVITDKDSLILLILLAASNPD